MEKKKRLTKKTNIYLQNIKNIKKIKEFVVVVVVQKKGI
jgi:hypothetical protein